MLVGCFLVVFQEKNFCTESHTIFVSVCGCKCLGRRAGWKCPATQLEALPKP